MKLKIIDLDIKKIKLAPYNPRRDLDPTDSEYQTLSKSLQEFDLVEPLVWNEKTGNLISGHQRFKILLSQGVKTVPVSVVSLPLQKEKALNVTLNNRHVGGGWDENLLKEILVDIESMTPDLYDSLEMAAISKKDLGGSIFGHSEEGDDEDGLGDGPPEMELLPYEHYDYIVLLFRDSRDFLSACDHFEIKRESAPRFTGKKSIGLGRGIDGAKYLARIKKH